MDPKVLQDQSNKLKLWALAWRKSRSKVVEFDMCVLKHALVDLHKNSYFKIFICGTLKSYPIGVMCPKWATVTRLDLVYWTDRDRLYFLTFIRETEEKPHHYNSTYPFVSNGISGTRWDSPVSSFWDMTQKQIFLFTYNAIL